MSDEIRPTLLTLVEAADRLRLSPNTVYKMCREGELPARKVGRQWRIREEDLANWLRQDSSSEPSTRPGAIRDPLAASYKGQNHK
jgi:excisionase family DNA binding protein